MTNSPKKVIFHCALTPDSEESKFSIEDVTEWHVKRGFDTVGYHYYITRDGEVHKGRADNIQGAHCVDSGGNKDSLGVCYEGTRLPSPAQWDAVFNLYRQFRETYYIDFEHWFGHNEYVERDCPGFSGIELRSLLRKIA